MKSIKKIAAVTIVMTMVLNLAACSKKDEKDVIKATDSFVSAVVKGDSKKILKTSNLSDKKLDESLFEYDKGNDDDFVKLAIIDEISYEIDEKTLEISRKDKDASVDVVFKIPDYEKVFDETTAPDAKALVDEIKEADKIELNVSVELTLEDDEWTVSNANKVLDKTLGEIKKVEIPELVNLDDLEFSWWGEEDYDGTEATYTNTSYIAVEIEGIEDYSKVRYTVEFGGKVVYESEMGEDYGSYSEYEGAEFDDFGCLPVGDYTITFYVGSVKLTPCVAHVVEGELDYAWWGEKNSKENEAWFEDTDEIELDLYSYNRDVTYYTIELDGNLLYKSLMGNSYAYWNEENGAKLVNGCIAAGDYKFTFYVNGNKLNVTFIAHVTNSQGDGVAFGMLDEMAEILDDDFGSLVTGLAWFNPNDDTPMDGYCYEEGSKDISYVIKFMDGAEGDVYYAVYYNEDTTEDADLDSKPVDSGVKGIFEYIDEDGNKYLCVRVLSKAGKNGKYTIVFAEDETLETVYMVTSCVVGDAG